MALIKFANFAKAKLATAPSGAGGLTFSVEAGKGALYPSPSGSEYFYGIFKDASGNREIVKIESRTGEDFTIESGGRGLDGTTARTWLAGDYFVLGLTSIAIEEVIGNDAINAIGQLTPVADRVAYYTGASTAALATLTAVGRSVIAGLTAAGIRSTLDAASVSTDETISGNKTLSGRTTLADLMGTTLCHIQGASFHATNKITVTVTEPTAARSYTFPDKDVDLGNIVNLPLGAPDTDVSVAASALTGTINPCTLLFRSATVTDGTPEVVEITGAITVVAPSGATLGTISNVKSRIALLAINNAGTAEAAFINLDGGTAINEQGVISTTAIDATSDTKGVAYSTTARSNVAYRVVNIMESTQTTAGTWNAAPALVSSAFGNAVTSMDSIGYGQVWTDETSGRSAATDYYNDTGKPIHIKVRSSWINGGTIELLIDGNLVDKSRSSTANHNQHTVSAIIPPGSKYRVNVTTYTIEAWWELHE